MGISVNSLLPISLGVLVILLRQASLSVGAVYGSLDDLPGYSADVEGEEVLVTVEQGTFSGRRRQGDPRAGKICLQP